jgi:hypothetical protein
VINNWGLAGEEGVNRVTVAGATPPSTSRGSYRK